MVRSAGTASGTDGPCLTTRITAVVTTASFEAQDAPFAGSTERWGPTDTHGYQRILTDTRRNDDCDEIHRAALLNRADKPSHARLWSRPTPWPGCRACRRRGGCGKPSFVAGMTSSVPTPRRRAASAGSMISAPVMVGPRFQQVRSAMLRCSRAGRILGSQNNRNRRRPTRSRWVGCRAG
jgi:hypothetical protein